jgi:hypothetical protein
MRVGECTFVGAAMRQRLGVMWDVPGQDCLRSVFSPLCSAAALLGRSSGEVLG